MPLWESLAHNPDRTRLFVDLVLTVLLVTLVLGCHGVALFNRLEWVDWIAYALPAANLVHGEHFALPQLGQQHAFDRVWLWNSAWVGLGPVPAFVLFGVGRTPYLIGCFLGDAFALVTIALILRKALRWPYYSVAVFATYTFLGTRSYYAELYNQRYAVFCVAALALLFSPGEQRPSWKWLLAGILPLIHPSMFIGAFVWIGSACIAVNSRLHVIRPPGRSVFFLITGIVLTALWYVRPEAYKLQLLPNFQGVAGRSGWNVYASSLTSVPTYATAAAVFLLVFYVVWTMIRTRSCSLSALRVTVALAGAELADLLMGFPYLHYYVLGLGPVVFALAARRARNLVLTVLLALAGANAAVSWRLERTPPILVAQSEPVDFIVRHTRPGDRITLAPPFVLAASANLPEGRSVRHVVPQPFIIPHFDEQAYRSEVRSGTDVYIGSPDFFRVVTATKFFNKTLRAQSDQPLFVGDEITLELFAGDDRPQVRSGYFPHSAKLNKG